MHCKACPPFYCQYDLFSGLFLRPALVFAQRGNRHERAVISCSTGQSLKGCVCSWWVCSLASDIFVGTVMAVDLPSHCQSPLFKAMPDDVCTHTCVRSRSWLQIIDYLPCPTLLGGHLCTSVTCVRKPMYVHKWRWTATSPKHLAGSFLSLHYNAPPVACWWAPLNSTSFLCFTTPCWGTSLMPLASSTDGKAKRTAVQGNAKNVCLQEGMHGPLEISWHTCEHACIQGVHMLKVPIKYSCC